MFTWENISYVMLVYLLFLLYDVTFKNLVEFSIRQLSFNYKTLWE